MKKFEAQQLEIIDISDDEDHQVAGSEESEDVKYSIRPQQDEAEVKEFRKCLSSIFRSDEGEIELIVTQWRMLRYVEEALKDWQQRNLKAAIIHLESLLQIVPRITKILVLKYRSVIDAMQELRNFNLPASSSDEEDAENIRFLASAILCGIGVNLVLGSFDLLSHKTFISEIVQRCQHAAFYAGL